jgi:hypothetical protein
MRRLPIPFQTIKFEIDLPGTCNTYTGLLNYQSLDWVPPPIVIPEEQEVDTKKKEEDVFWIISWK